VISLGLNLYERVQVFRINTKRFIGNKKGEVISLVASRVTVVEEHGKPKPEEIPDSEMEFPADLVILALGFAGAEESNLIGKLGLKLTPWGTVRVDEKGMTSVEGIFGTGDMDDKCRRDFRDWRYGKGAEFDSVGNSGR